MQEDSNATTPTQSEAFLAALVGKPIVVHTLVSSHEASARPGVPQAGRLHGRLQANYPDAIVLEIVERERPDGGRILIYKRAIVAIEAQGAMTP
jgi:hypothetical protein